MFPKPKRTLDRDAQEEVRNGPCVVCGKTPSDPNHVRSVGSGGGDERSNLMPLCRFHHCEWHTLGVTEMCIKYREIIQWLRDWGWEFKIEIFHH